MRAYGPLPVCLTGTVKNGGVKMTQYPEREPVDEHEHVYVSPEREERIVHDVAAEQRMGLARITQLIWLVAMVIEALIGIRILLKLIAANPNSGFAALIYGITDLFLLPFFGLTITPSANGVVLEIPSIIAMLVYALFFWGLVKVIWLLFVQPRARTVTTYERDPHV
jgi:hypothetical protein